MSNLTLFINSFCSYLFVYIIFAVCMVVAFVIGVNLRKNKNKKEKVFTGNNETENKID